jgi:hypothetical protein
MGGFSTRFFSQRGTTSEGGGMLSSTLSQRDSKLGNNVCVLQPSHVLTELHKKSYFKAATGFLLGQERSLELRQSERLNEVFAHIAKNLKVKKDSTARSNINLIRSQALSGTGRTHTAITSEYSPKAQGSSPDHQPRQESPAAADTKNLLKGQKRVSEAAAQKPPKFALVVKEEPAVTTQTSRNSSRLEDEQDPRLLTTNVLKLCNIIR